MPDIYVTPKNEKLEKTPIENDKAQIGLESLGLSAMKKSIASFASFPVGVAFETQEDKEKIILLLRMHWITNLKWISIAFLLLLAPLTLNVYPIFSFLPWRFQIAVNILWYLFTLAFVIEQFLTWYFNVYIITDERIIDIDFYNLLHRQISEAKIDKIQDVNIKTGGIFASLFNYGDILIQTAGEVPNFDFRAVENPNRVTKILQGLRTQEEIEAIEGRVR